MTAQIVPAALFIVIVLVPFWAPPIAARVAA